MTLFGIAEIFFDEIFFRNAVISQRNGRLLLMFRIGNMRSSHLLQAQVRAQLVHKVEIFLEIFILKIVSRL